MDKNTVDPLKTEAPAMRAVRESVYYLKTLLLASGQELKKLALEEFYIVTIDDKEYYRTQFSYEVDSDQNLFNVGRRVYKNVFLSVADFSLKSIEIEEKP